MKRIIYFLTIAIALAACNMGQEQEITWDLDSYPDMLVVESIITNEVKQQAIHLTITGQYFDTIAPRPVSGAIAQVVEGENTYTFSESQTQPGWYFSDDEFSGQPLKTYRLEITLSNSLNRLTDYFAESTMPEGIDMDSIQCEIYEMPEFELSEEEEEIDSTILGILYYGNEPASVENYYMDKIFKNEMPLQSSAKEFSIYNDDYRNGYYSHFNTYNKNVEGGDIIKFRIYSIEKGFYKYIEGIQNADQSGNVNSMSGPPANAVGNISNGKALGFFTASYVSEKTAIAVDMR